MSYYDEYVGHMLRTFFAQIPSDQLSTVGQSNCAVCDRIMQRHSDWERNILREVYVKSKKVHLDQTVRNCAINHSLTELDVWRMIRAVSKEIALERGLID